MRPVIGLLVAWACASTPYVPVPKEITFVSEHGVQVYVPPNRLDYFPPRLAKYMEDHLIWHADSLDMTMKEAADCMKGATALFEDVEYFRVHTLVRGKPKTIDAVGEQFGRNTRMAIFGECALAAGAFGVPYEHELVHVLQTCKGVHDYDHTSPIWKHISALPFMDDCAKWREFDEDLKGATTNSCGG